MKKEVWCWISLNPSLLSFKSEIDAPIGVARLDRSRAVWSSNIKQQTTWSKTDQKRLNQKQPEVSKIGRLQSMQSQTCRKNMFQHSLQPPSRSGSHRTSVMRSSSCETDHGHLAMRAMASLVLDSNTDLSGIWMDKILLPMQCVFMP